MCASRLGFDVYLVKDCMINRRNKDLRYYKSGSFEEFYNWLKTVV